MASQSMNPGQKALEDRYAALNLTPADREKTPAALFGEMESWMFTLGEYRLFLNPLSGSWFWYDRPHDDWRDLGHASGTGIFYPDGDSLGFIPATAGGQDLPGAGEVRPAPGKKFCSSCGTLLVPGKKFCGNCGKPLS